MFTNKGLLLIIVGILLLIASIIEICTGSVLAISTKKRRLTSNRRKITRVRLIAKNENPDMYWFYVIVTAAGGAAATGLGFYLKEDQDSKARWENTKEKYGI